MLSVAVILDAVETGPDVGSENFGRLVVSSTAKNRIRTGFYEMNCARSAGVLPKDVPPHDLTCIGVVGAGTMGGGIAFTAALNGLPVPLLEVSQDALDCGLDAIRKAIAGQIKAGPMRPRISSVCTSLARSTGCN